MKVLLCAALVVACVQGYRNGETEIAVTLDPADKCHVTWSFDSTDSAAEITFKLEYETTGWVGIGLSPNGGMAGSDIIVGWVDSDGKAHIQDMHAVSNSLPLVDNSQDVELISGSEESGKTTLVFRRKINTCDQDDSVITSSASRLIYAYGERDPTNNVLTSADYHRGQRGVKTVFMLDSPYKREANPPDSLHFDLLQDNYEIPPEDTTYYCKFVDAPVLASKHHIISAEPLITPENLGIVHHIVIYGCWNVSYEHMRDNNKTEGVCHTEEMPEFFYSCRNIVYAWGIGGENASYPEDVGLPLGDSDTPEYYMMELHYDNSQLLIGRRDSSGIRFTYTPTLRRYDAGLVAMGNTYGIVVPPQQKSFEYVTYCHAGCTEKWVPDSGIYMLGYGLHSHKAGAAVKVEWYRDGKELEILAFDYQYDFNYQEYRPFNGRKKLLPGDTLKMTCTYNSEGRNNITYGGSPSKSEMCYMFLSYYPKQPISACGAFADFYSNSDSQLYSNLSLTPRRYGLRAYTVTLDEITDWTPEKSAFVQEYMNTDKRNSFCQMRSGVQETVELNPADFPEILQPKDEFCSEKDKNVNDEVDGDGNTAVKCATSCTLITVAVLTVVLSLIY